MIKETSKFMFHFNNNRLPPVFKKFFLTKKTENLPVQTKSGSTLIPFFCMLSTTQQSYRYKGPVVWNNLPPAIRYDCKSLKKFSNEVHNHLLKLQKKFCHEKSYCLLLMSSVHDNLQLLQLKFKVII